MRGTIFSPCAAAALALCLCAGGSGAAKREARVAVAAGPTDRRESVVTFELPRQLKGESYALQDETGRRLPLQVGAV